MVSEINQTPKALRLHIGVFGPANAGKSTFINLVSGQETAITSPVAGTTTDPVFKPMELLPLGPVVLIDTAGLDDVTELGDIRVKKSLSQLDICDCAVIVAASDNLDICKIKSYMQLISERKIPFLIVINRFGEWDKSILSELNTVYIEADLSKKESAEEIKKSLIGTLKNHIDDVSLTANLVKKGDIVLLVAPQDIQAPKGRLILPQVQILRDLLDNGCIAVTVTADNISSAIGNLKENPSLVITDSQIYKMVSEIIPSEIPLTSFSMLMAKTKGDISGFIKGARAIDTLKDGDKVIILESCSHHALDDDIARSKLPAMLKKYTGKSLEIINYSGQALPENLSDIKLALHCGGCMVNRRAMLLKQKRFEEMNIPMTNFGVAIAYINGLLECVCY